MQKLFSKLRLMYKFYRIFKGLRVITNASPFNDRNYCIAIFWFVMICYVLVHYAGYVHIYRSYIYTKIPHKKKSNLFPTMVVISENDLNCIMNFKGFFTCFILINYEVLLFYSEYIGKWYLIHAEHTIFHSCFTQ